MGRGSRRGSREGDRLRKNRGKAQQGPGRSPLQGHLSSETPKCPVPMLTRQMRPQTQDPTQSPGLAVGAFPQTSPLTRPANHFPLTLAEKRERHAHSRMRPSAPTPRSTGDASRKEDYGLTSLVNVTPSVLHQTLAGQAHHRQGEHISVTPGLSPERRVGLTIEIQPV